MKTKILLVEDDPNLGLLLKESLQLKGDYLVSLCTDGEQGLTEFLNNTFDICIFDVMMPKKDGFTLLKDIRKVNKEVPVIFATAKGMVQDKMEGFSIGADDYITKPFSIDELIMRIKAILKRTKPIVVVEEPSLFQLGKYTYNYSLQLLSHDGLQHKLSTKEAELLKLLCLHANEVLERDEALLKIWKDDNYFNGRSMDVFLSKLRKLLKDDPRIEIMTLHGKGYKLILPKE
jgi:DNA-binding response OmpR family regulator